jgi:hypothetical protein
MGWVLRLVERGTDNRAQSVDVVEISRPNDLRDIASLKLTLPEAKRHCAGLRVGTSITEGTANFLVNRRMAKSQQMRWSWRGADLLLQVRSAVYNGMLGSAFGRLFEPMSHPRSALAKAA